MLPGFLDIKFDVGPEVDLSVEMYAEVPRLMTLLDLLYIDPELARDVAVGQPALAEEDCQGLGGAELQARLPHLGLDLVQARLD